MKEENANECICFTKNLKLESNSNYFMIIKNQIHEK
jgi:hypothetical protein